MYKPQEIAKRIKEEAKFKKIAIGDILEACELGKNALSTMFLGSMPKIDTIAKIADCLGCSVDHLLDRSDQAVSIDIEGGDDVIILHRDGKKIVQKLSRSQADAIINLIKPIDEDSEA